MNAQRGPGKPGFFVVCRTLRSSADGAAIVSPRANDAADPLPSGRNDLNADLTGSASGMVNIHDRRPVTLSPGLARKWLDPGTQRRRWRTPRLVLNIASDTCWGADSFESSFAPLGKSKSQDALSSRNRVNQRFLNAESCRHPLASHSTICLARQRLGRSRPSTT